MCNADQVDIDWMCLEIEKVKYCQVSTDIADFDWIGRVILNTGERISPKSTYSDFTGEILTTLQRGSIYTLQVKGNTTSSYTEFVKA